MTAPAPASHAAMTPDAFEAWVQKKVAELRRTCNLVRVELDYKDDKLLTARLYETYRRGDPANLLE